MSSAHKRRLRACCSNSTHPKHQGPITSQQECLNIPVHLYLLASRLFSTCQFHMVIFLKNGKPHLLYQFLKMGEETVHLIINLYLYSVFSANCEKHIYKIILQQLNYPLSSHQWVFLPKRSTVTALLGISHNWFQSLNAGKEVCAVFLDLCKAFHSVHHLLLLHKQRDLCISHTILQCLFSYLRSRKQCVSMASSLQ